MRPGTTFKEHRNVALLENARFLREGGMSDEAIAQRLGIKLSTLEKAEERVRSDNRSASAHPQP